MSWPRRRRPAGCWPPSTRSTWPAAGPGPASRTTASSDRRPATWAPTWWPRASTGWQPSATGSATSATRPRAPENLIASVQRYLRVVEVVLTGVGAIALGIAGLGVSNALLAAGAGTAKGDRRAQGHRRPGRRRPAPVPRGGGRRRGGGGADRHRGRPGPGRDHRRHRQRLPAQPGADGHRGPVPRPRAAGRRGRGRRCCRSWPAPCPPCEPPTCRPGKRWTPDAVGGHGGGRGCAHCWRSPPCSVAAAGHRRLRGRRARRRPRRPPTTPLPPVYVAVGASEAIGVGADRPAGRGLAPGAVPQRAPPRHGLRQPGRVGQHGGRGQPGPAARGAGARSRGW